MSSDQDHPEPIPLTPAERLAARELILEPKFLVEGPVRERFAALATLQLLAAFFAFEVVLWTVTLVGFGASAMFGVPFAVLVAFIIAKFDLKLCAGDLAPRDFLRTGHGQRGRAWPLVSRIAIALVFGHATAAGVTVALFRDEAVEEQARVIDAQNRPIFEEYDRKAAALRASEEGPVLETIAALNDQRRAAASQATDAVHDADEALRARDAAELETDRQIGGRFGRRHGDGPLAEDARDQGRLAANRAAALRSDAATASGQVERIDHDLADAETRLAAAKPRVDRAMDRLMAERDAKLGKHTSGPLTVFEGLVLLERDPKTAPALNMVTSVIYPFVMVIELIICLSGIVFKPANDHDTAALLDLQIRAARRIHRFARELQQLRSGNTMISGTQSISVEETN